MLALHGHGAFRKRSAERLDPRRPRRGGRLLPAVPRRVTSCDAPSGDDLGWLPVEGALLTQQELFDMSIALRALISGTDADEPNRAHAVSIAHILSDAIDRSGGEG